MVLTPVPGMLKATEFGPLILFASWRAARRLHVPSLVAHTPSPIALSLRSLVLFTTNCNPVAVTAEVPLTLLGAAAGAGANCRSGTSMQPSPLTSVALGSLQAPPASRASAHAIDSVAASVYVT